MNYSFSKEKRICSNNQFVSILKNGKCVRSRLFAIYIAPNECGFSRLGISVGKSFGNAVKRNRIKRLVREAFRLNQNEIPCGYDYLVLIKKKIEQPTFEQIQEAFLSIVLHKR
ncbi:MAG: ribonuclease P protein component [Sedimentisphaerales bacterium]|nr:ribonuclease P protein component [Sedimentisphaerales bacterium]